MTEPTMPDTSERLLGTIRVLFVLARFENASIYCSATFKLIAVLPPCSSDALAIKEIA